MKKLKHLPIVLTTALILYSLGFNLLELLPPFRPVTIQEIQFKSNDSLLSGRDRSNILGDSVTIVGRVIAPPQVNFNGSLRSLLRGSNSWTCYLQDTANGVFGGIVVRQGSRFTSTNLELVDTGYIIRIKGYVQEFPATGFANSLTQIGLDTLSAPVQIGIISSIPARRPAPKLVNVSDFATQDFPNGGSVNMVGGEKYEGMYVEIRNVTVGLGTGPRQPWSIFDDLGNKLYIRDFSNFYTTDPANRIDSTYTHPALGTFINYIRGVIIAANSEGVFGTQLPYAIVPIYRNDLSLGNAPPVLSSPTRNPGVPTPPDSVQISVTASDPGLSPVTITDMKLFWRFNGGAFNNRQMPLVAGNIYAAKLPPAPLGTFVEYFMRSEDNQGAVKLLPTDTLRSKLFYIVRANDSMSVQDVQFCPNNGGRSAYEGYDVRGVEGIVTADTSDIPAFSFTGNGGNQTSPRRVYIQNGQGAFSGIWLSGTPTDVLRKGDRVRVKGTVEENFSVTRINVVTPSNIVNISSGNPQPSAEILSTSQLANSKQDGDTTIEKWESVFCRFNTPIDITCINAGIGLTCTTSEPLPDTTFRRNFGEILVRDASMVEARIELQDGNHTFTNNWDGTQNPPQPGYTLLTKNDIISFTEGILYFAFSNYKLTPRKNPDFGTVTPVGISNNTELVNNYYLSQNYPNPFNPVTVIKYNIPVSGNVSMKIYDMLGRELKTLLNAYTVSGTHSVNFDGSSFSSGVYFYKLEADGLDGNKFVMTKRMVLLK